MQENEFEKQVQSRMEQFKILPSAFVWEKINTEIHKKKRRKYFPIPLLFVAIALLGFSGLLYLYIANNVPAAKQDGHEEISKTANKKDLKKTGRATSTRKNKQTVKARQHQFINPDTIITNEKRNVAPVAQQAALQKKEHLIKSNESGLQWQKDIVDKQIRSLTYIAKQPTKVENKKRLNKVRYDSFIKRLSNSTWNNPQTDTSAIDKAAHDATTNVFLRCFSVSPIDIQPIQVSNELVAKNAPEIKLPDIEKINVLKFSRKIRWGLDVSGGATTRVKNPFGFLGFKSEEKSFLSSSFIGYSQVNANSGILVLPPSDTKAGPAFKVATVFEKSLSRRFLISLALQYAYSSDRISIGKPLRTTQDNNMFFSASASRVAAAQGNSDFGSRDYLNKYHALELPLQIQYNVSLRWKRPILWNAGVSVSQLIASNVLLYDDIYGGVYYDSKRDIRKTQLNLFTGVSLQFVVNRFQWSVGPQISVSALEMFNYAYANSVHQLYAGINARLIFAKTKPQ